MIIFDLQKKKILMCISCKFFLNPTEMLQGYMKESVPEDMPYFALSLHS